MLVMHEPGPQSVTAFAANTGLKIFKLEVLGGDLHNTTRLEVREPWAVILAQCSVAAVLSYLSSGVPF
jgi:hypothetical protein